MSCRPKFPPYSPSFSPRILSSNISPLFSPLFVQFLTQELVQDPGRPVKWGGRGVFLLPTTSVPIRLLIKSAEPRLLIGRAEFGPVPIRTYPSIAKSGRKKERSTADGRHATHPYIRGTAFTYGYVRIETARTALYSI